MQSLSPSSVTLRPRQRGFSLIEVMVALMVLAIGLLGLAGLQTLGLKFNTQSYQRTQAVLNAYDIIDRIRANSGGIGAAVYDDVKITLPLPPLPPSPDCGAVTCDNAQMANYDITQWKNSLAELLSQGKGAVCRGVLAADFAGCIVDPAGNTSFQVGVQWFENDIPMRLAVEAQL
ncbi:MAG: type IV pilus modification protein PilV [Gammaproteobacteria bacterium]